MKISSLKVYPVSIPSRPEFAIVSSLGEQRVTHCVLVAVHTDERLIGFGEANVLPVWSGETQAGAMAAIGEVLARVLIGKDPLYVTSLGEAMDRVLFANAFSKAGSKTKDLARFFSRGKEVRGERLISPALGTRLRFQTSSDQEGGGWLCTVIVN